MWNGYRLQGRPQLQIVLLSDHIALLQCRAMRKDRLGHRLELAAIELRILARSGTTEHLRAWWPTDERRAHVRATVQLVAPDADHAIARVRKAVQDAEELAGAEISYSVQEAPDERTSELERRGIAVYEGDLTVLHDLPTSEWTSRDGRRSR